MGNYMCGTLRKKKNEDEDDGDNHSSPDNKEEDVTYATIDHNNAKTTGFIEDSGDNDCDYAILNLPTGPTHQPSIKEDCADDYVLMG
ncbi:hypothetical protein J4Q44_G00195950 [Coregonus suidteri]|uniref:Uncharacterized protein n=1 Tax=Coregonus suidteri TaxID=861788 RepID=A0AAN8LHZ3_9TELE